MDHVAQLVVTSPRGSVRVYFLGEGQLVVGRATRCDVVLRDEKVSREHATIACRGGKLTVMDQESRHGTFVNGQRCESAELSGGDLVEIGEYELSIKTEDEPVAAEPRRGELAARLEEESILVESGSEPTVIESLAKGQATLTLETHGVEASINDTSVARLVVFFPGQTAEFELTGETTTIGRADDNDVTLQDPAASSHHARLERRGKRFLLRDLDSKNGTYVGGGKVTERLLKNGANVRIGSTQLVLKEAFDHNRVTIADGEPAAAPERKPVVVIPGIMGSELWKGEEMVWPHIRKMRLTPELIALPNQGLEVGRIARHVVVIPGFIKLDAYSKLVDFLEQDLGYTSGDDLLEFPYDWRLDNRKSARKLRKAIDAWKARDDGPRGKITIVAHSMGSLVTRYFIQCLGGADVVERVIFMGAPCFGSPQAVQGLVNGPRLLPLGIGNESFHKVICSLESAYQLVPTYECAVDEKGQPLDLFENDEWVQEEMRPVLHDAREFHREIGERLDVPSTFIFGYGVKTVTDIRVEKRSAEGWERTRFIISKSGDNRVDERKAYLEGTDIHPVRQYHGALWTDPDVQMRLQLELVG